VCDALSYTHRQGIVHGDVSPANILVRRDGVVKLTDFGVARTGWTARRGERGQPVGTPHYLAPEVAEGFAASPLSDIYSLGATAHRLIVGDSPRSGGAGDTTFGLERAAAYRPLLAGLCPHVPAALAHAIDRAMAMDPGERQPSVALFRSELAASRTAPAVHRIASLGATRRRPRPERPAA
jgi:eukaryotic-like serine/threonine-protein kinase